ncbi:MAG: type restriction enzyme subunit [Pyrinomonadaceae bacterium]|nr:type restriction enzyme subunit [Pyrinomonadaceae bacterium]
MSQPASTVIEISQASIKRAPLLDGWRWVQLKEVCERIDYGFTASADFKVNEPRFLRITDIQNGRVDWEQVPGCKINVNEEAANKLADGDIVFARTGGTTGKSFLIRNPPRAVFASYLIRLRASVAYVDSDFLYAFFQSDDYWRQIRSSARGGAQPNVNATLLGNLYFPLPSLPEQKRIAAIINEQLEAVERARAAADAQLKAAKDLPAAYLREVFESPEAEKWQKKRIDEFAQTCSGSTPSRTRADYYIGTISWVKTGELKDGFISDTEEHVSETALRECSIKLLPADTLLIAMYGQGQTRGRTGLLTIPATTNQACFAVLPNPDEFDSQYLQLWFRHNYSRLRRETEGRGGNQPNLNGEVLNRQQALLPSLEEQKAIVKTVAEQLMATEQIRKRLQVQFDSISELPAALLRQAFTGKI